MISFRPPFSEYRLLVGASLAVALTLFVTAALAAPSMQQETPQKSLDLLLEAGTAAPPIGDGPAIDGIVNGDFESGRLVGWTEYSALGYELVTTAGTAHSGSWSAWLGGDNNEMSEIAQTITVPAGGANLVYWGAIASEDTCGGDYGYVQVNSTYLAAYYLCSQNNTGYVQVTLSLNAYAGQTVALKFGATTNASAVSAFFVDDVSLAAGGTTPTTTQSPGTPTTTQSPGVTPSVTTTTGPGGAIVNGGFESGPGVGWTQFSMHGYQLIVQQNPVHSGSWHAQLGRPPATTGQEANNISQTITVPTTGGTLVYWYKIAANGPCATADRVTVYVGSRNVETYDLCTSNATTSYVQETVSLDDFAGQTVQLLFSASIQYWYESTFHLDDVALVSGVTPMPSPTPRVGLANGDFEAGRVDWTESTLHGSALIAQGPAHGGAWRAVLGNANNEISSISQTFTVPASGPSITYWYRISSDDGGMWDEGYVGINNSTLKTYRLAQATQTNGWVQDSISLASYAGQTVTLKFWAHTDSWDVSVFYIDDVVLGSGGGATPTPTVTRTLNPTPTPTVTRTLNPTPTPTVTRTLNPTPTPTVTRTLNPTPTPTVTRTVGSTPTRTPTATVTRTVVVTPTGTYSAAGTVTKAAGAAVSGATLSDSAGHSVVTDANGVYTLRGLAAGSYTLTPAKSGCTFTPPSRSITLPPDANAQNFTAACTATGTRVKIQPALTTVSLSPNSFNVTLVVNNVTNLAGYQTDLIYNPALLQVSAVAQGAFLGSTGRTVAPVGPVIDNTIGRVTFGAFTFGTAPGPNGSGTLATITIQPRAAGITALHLENLGLADTASNPIASIGDDGQVEITACFGDFNGDHRVDIFDLQMAAGHWNCRTGDACYDSRFDVIANGVIDVMDLQRIASAWGTVCGTLQESLGVSTAPALHPQSTSLALLPATAHAAPGAAFAQTVRLEDVANLAAYQADLVYDPALIRVEAVTIGPFLGSTGRTVTPVGPVIDNTAGRVTFGAFSFGTQPGVSGSGDLAVVHFQAMTAGQTTLEVQHPSIADPQGNPLSLADVAGSTVVVSSDPQHRILLPAVLRQP